MIAKLVRMQIETQKGAVLVLLSFLMSGLLAFAALALDIGFARLENRRIHYAGDAGALAGVKELIDVGPANAVAVARNYAFENGLQPGEIDGVVELGRWTRATGFQVGAVPLNAVRVPVKRAVPTTLGKLLGWDTLDPNETPVAVYQEVGDPDDVGATGTNFENCLVPFGVELSLLFGDPNNPADDLSIGDEFNVFNVDAGNWGKLDIGGNMSSFTNYYDAVVGGACVEAVAIGDEVEPGTGASALQGHRRAFTDRMAVDRFITIAVVDEFTNGNNCSNPSVPCPIVQGYLAVELLGESGGGRNWNGRMRIVSDSTGGTAGGAGGGGGGGVGPFPLKRVLVF